MQFSEITQPKSDRELRVFAGLQVVFFSGLCVWLSSDQNIWPGTPYLMSVSVAIGLLGLLKPQWMRPVYVTWMAAVFPIGWTISHLLMAIVYYGLFTPTGWWRRWRSGDPMQRELEPQASTYWEPHQQPQSADRYFRQF